MAQGIEKDNNQMLDEIFQAIDVITQKRLDKLQFDKTITCKIVSADNSEEGVYIVDDGSTQFLAFSENTTYSEGTWVYVTIPNGDFSLQKNIVGKYVTDNSEYSTYVDPFSTYLDITGNLMTEDSEVEHGLIANYSNEIVLWRTDSYKYEAPVVTVIDNLDNSTETTASQLSSFDRLGIQADFKTLLGKYGLNTGTYGLKLVIQTTDLGSSSTSQSITELTLALDTDNMFGDPYNYITWSTQKVVFDISNLENITAMKLVLFQNNDFKNDTVSYEQVTLTQSEYSPGVYFIKNGNEYILSTGSWSATQSYYKSNPYTYIPGYDKDTAAWDAYLKMANILAKNIYISLGYNLKNFTKDTILLYCFNGYTYSSYLTSEIREVLASQNPSLNLNDPTVINTQLNAINKKSLHLRWVHIDPETEAVSAIDNMDDFETYEGENDALQVEAAIHWYRWNMTDGLEDPLAGAFWEEITGITDPFNYDFIPNPMSAKEQIKVIIEYPSLEYCQYRFTNYEEDTLRESLEEEIIDEWTSQSKTYTAEELQAEITNRIKEHIPTYTNQNNLYSSEIVEFTNEQEVPNSISVNLVKGLEIICDEDDLNGVYNIYTSDGQLMNLGDASKLRILTARFNTLVTGDETLDRAESITWYLPVKNTMIQQPALGYEYSSTDSFSTDGEWYIIKREGVVSSIRTPGNVVPTQLEQGFRIKPYYSQTAVNNTVRCEVYKNNYNYVAEYTMEFGSSGSNGTDYSITVTYQVQDTNGSWKTATLPCLNIVNGAGSLKVVPHIFDYDHKDITEELISNISYSWYTTNPSNKLTINDNIISASGVTDLLEVIHYILEITVDSAVPLGNNRSVDLVAYCPIAVQLNNSYQGFDGDNRVTYDSSSVNPVYYKGQYCLYKKDATNTLIADNTVQWSVVTYENSLNAAQYYPQISATGYLTVPGLYLSDNDPRISLIATVNGTIVWGQPLYISKYVYSSAFLNSWDGGLTIDEENGTIMSAMIGAGRKDAQNRFNGVLMGDIRTTVDDNTSEVNTGLYGYNEGELSFGFDIDGTAFLGKQGHGRIEFDGNYGVIKSASIDNGDYARGMKIDLDDAFIDFYGTSTINTETFERNQAHIHIGVNAGTEDDESYFTITNNLGSILLDFSDDEQYLKSANYSDDNKTGTYFDIQNGRIYSYDFAITATSSRGQGTINIDSSADNTPLEIGENFSVDWSGAMVSSLGSIGGWTISELGLFSDIDETGNPTGVSLFSSSYDDGSGDPLRISVGQVSMTIKYYVGQLASHGGETVIVYAIDEETGEIEYDENNQPVIVNQYTTEGDTYFTGVWLSATKNYYESFQGPKKLEFQSTPGVADTSFTVTRDGQLEAVNAIFPSASITEAQIEYLAADAIDVAQLNITAGGLYYNDIQITLRDNVMVYSSAKKNGKLYLYRRTYHYLGYPYTSASTKGGYKV